MSEKIYKVTLAKEERKDLTDFTTKGAGNVRRLRRAQILLMADEAQEGGGWKDTEIAKALNAQRSTVVRARKKFVLEGLEAALNHARPQKRRHRVLDGAAEARLTQLACSQAPDGREEWSLRMLADKLVELEIVETVSYETVRITLKKTNLSLG